MDTRKALIAAGLLVSTPAWGQYLPDYDANESCRSVGLGPAVGKLMNDTCLALERKNQEEIAARWTDVPQSVRAYCVRVSNSYSTLNICVANELSSPAGRRASTPPPPPPARDPIWHLRTPDGDRFFDSLAGCSEARAQSKAAWATCSNR
jgi:hypothetical protein